MRWRWRLTEPRALLLHRSKTGKGKLIRLADELGDRVNWQEWITFVMFGDSWLPLPLCVSSNYTGTYGSGRQGDESAVKPGREQSQKQKEGAKAWTPSHDRQPLGLFYSAARSFLGFVLSALPSHPPRRPPSGWCSRWFVSSVASFESTQRLKADALCLLLCNQPTCLQFERLLKLFPTLSGFVCVWAKGHFRWYIS